MKCRCKLNSMVTFSLSLQARGISNVCERKPNVCSGNPCGEGGICLDRWLKHMCICPNGLMASNCDTSMYPASFSGDSYVEFLITEQHRRRQLLPKLYQRHSDWSQDNVIHNRISRQVSVAPPKSLSLRFRTVAEDGVLLHAATNNDYTMVAIRGKHLEYTSKLGANLPINITITEVEVTNGAWYNLTLFSSEGSLRLLIDDKPVGEELELTLVHDFLDAYLTSITLGSSPRRGFIDEDLPGEYKIALHSSLLENQRIFVRNQSSRGIYW